MAGCAARRRSDSLGLSQRPLSAMSKTTLTRDPADKARLDRHLLAPLHGQPQLAEVLHRSAGLWRQDDGLAWQRRLREEWDAGTRHQSGS